MNYYNPYTPPTQDPYAAYLHTQKLQERNALKKLSWGAAIATGGFFLLANFLYGVYYMLPGVFARATSNAKTEADIILQLSVDLLFTMLSLLIPFGAVYLLNKKAALTPPIALNKPRVSGGEEALLLIGGCGMLLLSGSVTGYLTTAFESITGISFLYSFFDTPTSALGLVIFYLRAAIMPAILEEFAMRGVVMQPLRRYGDLFALTMSSMVFALMHGNMIQTPFAFLAGFVLGYAVIRSGSLWTSIIIHCINNTFSITVSVLNDNVSTEMASVVSLVGTAVLIVGGVAAVAVLFTKKKLVGFAGNISYLPSKLCYKSYILTVPMILVLIYMLFQTALMIDIPGVTDFADWYSSVMS